MENKKDLAKIAYAALVVTAALPAIAAADYGIEAKGTYLAAGCKSSSKGCATLADNERSPSDVYNTRSNSYQMNDQAPGSSAQDAMKGRATQRPESSLTEERLLEQLNPETKKIYLSLNPEGKALARQLASQGSYRDINFAVKDAQRQMNERSFAR